MTPKPLATAAALALLAFHPAAAVAAWSGWARCDIDIQGPGYTNKETHTWFVVNASPTVAGSGSWNAVGRGVLDQGNPAQTSQHAEWSINASDANGARYGVIVGGGTVEIRPLHAQLRQSNAINGYVQQTISNSPRTPTPIAATQYEWAFPVARGTLGNPTIAGNFTRTVTNGWGTMKPSGAVTTESCTWSFADGSTPPPPPQVMAPPPPVPPGQMGTMTPQPPPSGTIVTDPCASKPTPRVKTPAMDTVRENAPRKDGEKIVVCPQ